TTDFPTLSGVKISQRVNINSLQLTVQKVMLFDAERVNIRAEQLPCALLEYAISLQFNYDPASGQAAVPTSGVTPNTHVKVFSP
ncbi:hypothetical protein ACKI1Z_42755, partial [Streptomyces galilaeus]|uniref:hypothetical protein n=1 Tax=Streptomyces galilaeus TaxID=33899 RepID=UPI0038F6085F